MQRRGLSVGGSLVVAAALFALIAAPGHAARQITPPPDYFCGNYQAGKISIIPPRIWSSYNRPEYVTWVIAVDRWNNARRAWYQYMPSITLWSTYNWYGQSVTSWGPLFTNSKVHVKVDHVGYYRVASAIQGSQGGVKWAGHIGGTGAYCYMN